MDQDLLNILLEKVAIKFGYSEPDSWSDGIFGQLSEEIEKETKFIISRNTLKRLFGKIKTSEHYSPQIDTRNALAQFVGYQDWNKFRMEMLSVSKSEKSETLTPDFSSAIKPFKWQTLKKGLILVGGLILAFVAFLFWPTLEPDYSKIQIRVENPIDTAPFTLIVHYHIPEQIKDSIFLGVGGEKYLLKKDKNIYVHSLHRPIYSFVYLKTKTKTLKAIAIKAYSRNIECFYEGGKNFLLVPKNQFISNGKAGLLRSYFFNSSLDSTHFITRFITVKDFKTDADNFKFSCRFKTDKSARSCQSFQLKIFADSGHHELEIFNKGCAQYNYLAPSEKYFGGNFENLTELSVPSGSWNNLEIIVENKHFWLYINGVKKFETSYTKTMAQVNAVIFQFKGFGQIDYYRFTNLQNKLTESEDF